MRKLLTKAILAGVLTAVFSVYGETSNLVFYSDFQNAFDQQPMDTAADMNAATVDQVGAWSLTSDHSGRNSIFEEGLTSMILFFDYRQGRSGELVGALSKVCPYTGANAVRFEYEFKPVSSVAGLGYKSQIIGYTTNNAPAFLIEMSVDANDGYTVKVNGTLIGQAFRSNKPNDPLNSMSLLLDSSGIDVTLINGSTLQTTTVENIPVFAGGVFTEFRIASNIVNKNVRCNWDNFKVYEISREPPPPRLDLFILTDP